MSYNTRRGPGFGTPSSAVGQRRPPAQQQSANYTSAPQAQIKQQPQTPQQKMGAQTPNRPQQNPSAQQLQQTPKAQPQQQTKPTPATQQQQTPKPQQVAAQNQEPKIVFKNANAEQPMEVEGDQVTENGEGTETGKVKKVLFFRTGKGKISKKERLRRRNLRLRKLLQPKNAPMVLNELVGSVTYNIIEAPQGFTEDYTFKATVNVDGMDHHGYGKSKVLAKSNAAEAAIKHLVLKKVTSSITTNPQQGTSEGESEDVKMEEGGEEDNFSWSHVASFALHKLFNSWDDTAPEKIPPQAAKTIIKMMGGVSPSPGNLARLVANPHSILERKPEAKPAKKMPENAEQMNPIMLLNQMRPGAYYEEVSKTGTPPNVKFTFRCCVDGQQFTGTGSNKKIARKHAAYTACQNILQIIYPQDVLQGIAENS